MTDNIKKEYLQSVMRKLEKRGLSGDELKAEMDKAEAGYKEEVSPMQAVLDKNKLIVQLQTEVHNLKDENRILREELQGVVKSPEPTGNTPTQTDKFCDFCDSKGGRHKKECSTLLKAVGSQS